MCLLLQSIGEEWRGWMGSKILDLVRRLGGEDWSSVVNNLRKGLGVGGEGGRGLISGTEEKRT